MPPTLRCVLVDRYPALLSTQADLVAPSGPLTLALASELLDDLPFDRPEAWVEGWAAVFVAAQVDELVEVPGPLPGTTA